MRASSTFLAAASILSLAAASPLERRYQECTAPQAWHRCSDGWAGCCSVSPCKGPGEGVASHCPDTEPQPPAETPTPIKEPSSACSPESTPSSAPSPSTDTDWTRFCKADDSNCNWAPTYFIVKTDNETYTTYNTTNQFHVQKDDGLLGGRRDSIALFKDIPDTVTKCRIAWYVLRSPTYSVSAYMTQVQARTRDFLRHLQRWIHEHQHTRLGRQNV